MLEHENQENKENREPVKTYAIGAVAKLTGLTVHNLRVWEKRHQAFDVLRTETGRRVYTQANLDRIQLLKRCVDMGHSISMIAHVDNQELADLIENFHVQAQRLRQHSQQEHLYLGVVLSSTALNFDALPFKVTNKVASLAEFEASLEQAPCDVWWLEFETLDEALSERLISHMHAFTPEVVLVVYRFAPTQVVETLKAQGIMLHRSPVEIEVIGSLLQQHFEEMEVPELFKPEGVYPRKLFTKTQLTNITQLSPQIECECPRHMVDMIRQLTAFERYMQDCRHRNQQDAELHHALQYATAESRVIIEKALKFLLKTEAIPVEDWQ